MGSEEAIGTGLTVHSCRILPATETDPAPRVVTVGVQAHPAFSHRLVVVAVIRLVVTVTLCGASGPQGEQKVASTIGQEHKRGYDNTSRPTKVLKSSFLNVTQR